MKLREMPLLANHDDRIKQQQRIDDAKAKLQALPEEHRMLVFQAFMQLALVFDKLSVHEILYCCLEKWFGLDAFDISLRPAA